MVLEVKNLKKSFLAGVPVLSNVSFSLNAGEVVSVIGSSGSGKSTLLRCIAQLETVNSGNITIDGTPLVTTSEDGTACYTDKETAKLLQRKIGMVFQSFYLFPHYSVLRNLTDAPIRVLKMEREAAEKKAMLLLEKMGLSDRAAAYPCELSGGQQQRVAIARALMLDPDILCFDEPTSALDPELTGEVLKVIRALKDEGRTMIVVTHEMEFARHVSDKIIFMADGIVEAVGTPDEIFGGNASEKVQSFLGKARGDALGL